MSVGKKYRATCCDTIIQSKHRHDFVSCKCGKVSIDGGGDYVRVIGEGGNLVEVDGE